MCVVLKVLDSDSILAQRRRRWAKIESESGLFISGVPSQTVPCDDVSRKLGSCD